MEDFGIPKLTSQQAEALCETAENAARKYLLSKAHEKNVERLSVCAEVEGTGPVNLEIDVETSLSASARNLKVQGLVNEAVKEGFESAEGYLKGLACHSQK